MDNANRRSPDDIPEALRDVSETPTASGSNLSYLIAGLAIAIAIVGTVLWYFNSAPPKTASVPANNAAPTPASASPSPATTQLAPNVNPSDGNSDALLGHFAYAEAPQSELQTFAVNGRSLTLRKAAAQEFQAMVKAARADGVNLVPISGFRSMQEQQRVYFDIQAQRKQTVTKRAEVSAPPGYSEHHTGYAVDIGDAAVPATNLNPNFENTKAYKWLADNAARFHFEMSFPQDNPQGVSYEPWHWRFVGDRQSLETFYKARDRQQ